MSAPRLEIDLGKIHHNTHTLTRALTARGVSVTAVTKACLGSPQIAATLLDAGVNGLADSRIENIETMRGGAVSATMTLIRSPMLSQVPRIVRHADISFNTELAVIRALSEAAQAQRLTHGIVLMVELGDIREGIMPADLQDVARQTLLLPNLKLRGIGANLACRSGVVPDAGKMTELSALVGAIEARFDLKLDIVSGGNSANLDWALGGAPLGRVTNLRLGESILLGLQPLRREKIPGLHTDAVTFVGEVIESKTKPSQPWGYFGLTPFGEKPPGVQPGPPSTVTQTILAIGHQDTDPGGLRPPAGIEILSGAGSDHLVIESRNQRLQVGDEVRFQPNYSALVRAMSSPFVDKELLTGSRQPATPPPGGRRSLRTSVQQPVTAHPGSAGETGGALDRNYRRRHRLRRAISNR